MAEEEEGVLEAGIQTPPLFGPCLHPPSPGVSPKTITTQPSSTGPANGTLVLLLAARPEERLVVRQQVWSMAWNPCARDGP